MTSASVIGSRAPRPIAARWEIAAVRPGQATVPRDLDMLRPDWLASDAAVPAGAALRAAGLWDLDHRRDFDADDWWYRGRFPSEEAGGPVRLRFEGLATLADVWLNGEHILRSENMFVAHTVDVTRLVRSDNELVLRFHALAPQLASKPGRGRPRWRTGLVEHQALRWHRTSLLGRMPAWCPPAALVGPWRPILIETSPLELMRTHVNAVVDGDAGLLRMDLRVRCQPPERRRPAPDFTGTLIVGGWDVPLGCDRLSDDEYALTAAARVPTPDRWWPHTHGPQPLYDVRAILTGPIAETVDLGRTGFRSLDVDCGQDGRGFGVVVNQVPVFCRGLCWTPLDLVHPCDDRAGYRSTLALLREAGVNMIRIGGTTTYESDRFHDLCDELGILVWQDFMFANMDYPWQDESFAGSVTLEATQVLEALQARPSTAVVCGSSEIDQQAAMLGLAASRWSSSGCDALLGDLVAALAPGAVWIPTTPTGGTFPFHADAGVSHYYGVGAYRRPLDDARRAAVRFAAECLAFSNVPDPATIEFAWPEGEAPGQGPRWKARVPRDAGATWDFEDVRDYYVEQLFGVRASELAARSPERYLALGRVATGESMLRTFAEWRRPGSTCRGGLVWFARDFQPGAGWGVIDSTGRSKASYWYLKRALAPVALLSVDEGLNGLWLHAVNDTPEPIEADLRVALYLAGRLRGEPAGTTLIVPARGSRSIHADALFPGFLDLTYAYRFGPPGHDVVASSMRDRATGALLAASYHFPGPLPSSRVGEVGITARAEPAAEGYALLLETERFAYAVAVEVEGFIPDDNYFNLEPGETRRIGLRQTTGAAHLWGRVSALNGSDSASVIVSEAIHAG
jgi:beta-mannosidase